MKDKHIASKLEVIIIIQKTFIVNIKLNVL